MATIEIVRSHSKTVEEIKAKVSEMSGSLDANYAIRSRWQGDAMLLQGSGPEPRTRPSGQDDRMFHQDFTSDSK